MDTSVADVTVRAELPVTSPILAVMVVDPAVTHVTLPPELETVATLESDELQVTQSVRSIFVPSLEMPIAVYFRLVPTAILAVAGVTWIDAI